MHFALAILVVASLVGCGGDDDPRDAVDSDWQKQVVGLCEENTNRAERAVLQLTIRELGRREFAARVLELSVSVSRPLFERMEALEPPDGQEAEAREFLDGLREVIPLYLRGAEAVRAGDEEAMASNNQAMFEAAIPLRALARELDIESCIPSGSTPIS